MCKWCIIHTLYSVYLFIAIKEAITLDLETWFSSRNAGLTFLYNYFIWLFWCNSFPYITRNSKMHWASCSSSVRKVHFDTQHSYVPRGLWNETNLLSFGQQNKAKMRLLASCKSIILSKNLLTYNHEIHFLARLELYFIEYIFY